MIVTGYSVPLILVMLDMMFLVNRQGLCLPSSFSSFNLCLSECLCWVNSAIDNLILDYFYLLFTIRSNTSC